MARREALCGRAAAPRTGRAVAGAAALAFLLAGCAGGPGSDAPGPEAPDSVRGTVSVVGADPTTRVVLRTPDGRLTVTGPTDVLRRVNGLVVRADGTVEGATMRVVSFRVVAADGMPAADGVLELDGDAAVLVTPAGERLRFAPAPASLRARVGARVWIAGEVGGEPQAWGVIGQ